MIFTQYYIYIFKVTKKPKCNLCTFESLCPEPPVCIFKCSVSKIYSVFRLKDGTTLMLSLDKFQKFYDFYSNFERNEIVEYLESIREKGDVNFTYSDVDDPQRENHEIGDVVNFLL